MKKIIAFFKMSNRYKHLIGGLMVGLLGFTPWTAFYAAAIAASCLELKDTLRGSPWDWIDWGAHRRGWQYIRFILDDSVIRLSVLPVKSVTLQAVEFPNSPCGLSRVQQCECEWRCVECECE